MSNEPGFKPVQILADSSCDLPQEVLDRYNIRIIPMYIALGEKDYRDGDITATDIYAHFEKTQQTPKTAAPNVSDYQDLFKPFIDEGKEIVLFSISSQMSGSFQNARVAAESFPDAGIYCIDSKSLSSGVGLQIMHACQLAQAGKSAGEIAREALLMAERTQASFVLAQLEYLHRGGRCSAVSAYAATLLSIRPEILVKDGAMIPGSKYPRRHGESGQGLRKARAERLRKHRSEARVRHLHAKHRPGTGRHRLRGREGLGLLRGDPHLHSGLYHHQPLRAQYHRTSVLL